MGREPGLLQQLSVYEAERETLLREAGGHPLFLRELARASADARSSVVTATPLDEILRSRIGRLPFAARALLEVVSLAGVQLASQLNPISIPPPVAAEVLINDLLPTFVFIKVMIR